ncbi:HAD family phosphatase [Micromonospora sp. WP24]|uniref:HAD family hydrolase n=1 Tax=Micromonospora sp. WP24 TaxID=2604469 RepID=UPI0011DB0DEF|nr:HAD family phosphatase [Micromonospora sp. WP24]TYC02127.1 HAD family phosphatase [Micromonospora sp. WP24]
MPQTLLFDLFGVIARQQSPAGQELLVAAAGASAPEFWAAYWALRAPYDRGEVTGPEYWRQVASTLGTTFDDRQIDRLLAADLASWSAVDDDMVALVEETAASGWQLALVSNIPEELAVHYEQHHHWLRHFDLVAFSCRIGHAKPEPEAYRWCCRALDLAPGRILFIDDRRENIRAAEAFGMRTHLFTGSAQARRAIAELEAARQH